MLGSISAIETYLRVNDSPNWILYPFQNKDDYRLSECIGQSMDSSINKIKEVIELMNHTKKFTLLCSKHEDVRAQKKGVFEINIILPNTSTNSEKQIDITGHIDNDSIEKRINSEIDKRMELIALKMENEHLKEKLSIGSTNSTLKDAMDMLKPYMPRIFKSLENRNTASIGRVQIEREVHTSDTSQDDTEKLQKYLKDIINQCEEKDIDPIEVFEKLSKGVTKNPDLLDDIDIIL